MAEIHLGKGVNPLDPDVVAAMKAGKERIEQEFKAPSTLIESSDLADGLSLAGYHARPFSAGMIALLEMVQAPALFGDGDPDLTDMMVLLWMLLTEEPETVLVDTAMKGYEAMKRAALTWSFGLSADVMRRMTDELPAIMERINATMDMYGSDDQSGDGKKK